MVIAALLRLREAGTVLPFASSVSSLFRSRSGRSHARVTQSGVATRPSSRLYVLAGNRAAHFLTLSLSKSMIYMDVCKKFCKRCFCEKNCCTEIMKRKKLWPFSSPEPLGLICNRPRLRDQETTGSGDENELWACEQALPLLGALWTARWLSHKSVRPLTWNSYGHIHGRERQVTYSGTVKFSRFFKCLIFFTDNNHFNRKIVGHHRQYGTYQLTSINLYLRSWHCVKHYFT